MSFAGRAVSIDCPGSVPLFSAGKARYTFNNSSYLLHSCTTMDLIEDEIQELPGPVDTREAPSSEAAPDKTLAEEKLPRIPNPPSDDPTDTIDDLQKRLQDFACANGFAIIRRNASNYRNGKPTYYKIMCDKDSIRESEGHGHRRTATQKSNCPWYGVASARASEHWKWSFMLKNPNHNHGPSMDPSVHRLHRKMADEQKALLSTISQHKAIKPREVAAIVREAVHGTFVKQKDVDNRRQWLRLDALKGRTPVQAFFHILRDSGLRHRVLWNQDESERPDAIVWTYPWCEHVFLRCLAWTTHTRRIASKCHSFKYVPPMLIFTERY
jgi:hypothetical protein